MALLGLFLFSGLGSRFKEACVTEMKKRSKEGTCIKY
jgi:hypothetical protein